MAFTRDPATGEKIIYGDYLLNAQGEDVVAGIRNTKKLKLANEMPEAYQEFMGICDKLENHYREMQDVEFTIEMANCGCCKPAMASEQPKQQSRSPSIWRMRD